MVKAGLKSIYLSGWQVAADANSQNTTYPDQSLYPSNSGPILAKRINNALLRAEQIERVQGNKTTDYIVPIVADGESGFGGALNVFELTKQYIESGIAGINYEIMNHDVQINRNNINSNIFSNFNSVMFTFRFFS